MSDHPDIVFALGIAREKMIAALSGRKFGRFGVEVTFEGGVPRIVRPINDETIQATAPKNERR